jgi:hypothetical protein
MTVKSKTKRTKCHRASCTRTVLDPEKDLNWTYLVDVDPATSPLAGWICPECTKELEKFIAS